jgi:hypothetical protein
MYNGLSTQITVGRKPWTRVQIPAGAPQKLNPSSFPALVALLYFFCKPTVFYYEGTFIAAVKAFPNGRAIEDEKIDVCGTAFWTELHSS